jgi:hypothetical protein
VIGQTTFGDNVAVPNGGAIYHDFGDMTVSQSTFLANQASRGGAIYIYNNGYASTRLTLVNSTLSRNEASVAGGGLYNDHGSPSVYSSTIPSNSAGTESHRRGQGGGIYDAAGGVQIRNTILADNVRDVGGATTAPDECVGTVASSGYSLVETPTGCGYSPGPGDIVNMDPELEPLDDNGGPTLTQAIPLTSPAIDAGNPNGCADPAGTLADDQRGWSRHLVGQDPDVERCDIGAYENGEAIFPTP